MAFKDLQREVLEEFSSEARDEQQALAWQSRRRAAANRKRSEQRADATLDYRLVRKRNRTVAERAIPPIPRNLSCVVCREQFMNEHGLATHCSRAHRLQWKLSLALGRAKVSCLWCRQGFMGRHSLDPHTVRDHAEAHALAVQRSMQVTAALARSHLRQVSALPALTAVRSIARVDAPIAHYRRFVASR